MNDFKFSNFTPKRILVAVLLFIAFIFLYSIFSTIFGHSRGFFSEQGMNSRVSKVGFSLPVSPQTETTGMMSASLSKGDSYDYGGIPEMEGDTIMPPPGIPPQTPPVGSSKIVKSAELTLLVAHIDDSANAITQLRTRFGGEPGNASFNEYAPGMKTAEMTIWVPSAKFDEALGEVKHLALRTLHENIYVSDVSAQYVDFTARLKNLHAAEAQYVEIMKRAGKISDILEVTRELNNTRAQIESIQGQLDHLARQVALAAIHISLTEEASPASVGDEWHPLTILKTAAKDALKDLANVADTLIVFIVKLPVFLLNIALWVFVLWVFLRIGVVVCRRLYHELSSVFSKDKI